MKILFLGDVFGRSGREALERHLPGLKQKFLPDIVIVNGENAANGAGITEKICKEFYAAGADVITTGNHVWDQREIIPYIGRDPNLLRPANFPEGTVGAGLVRYRVADGRTIVVVNMMGRLFMDTLDDPFAKMESILRQEILGQNCHAIFVDFHAETTSEKMAFAHHFDGRVSGVIGTHTHVPTADAHIMPGGTAYLTDAGMTGDYNSVIGVEKHISIHRFVKKIPGEKLKPASGEATVCGALVVTNDATGKAVSIEPLRIGPILGNAMPSGG